MVKRISIGLALALVLFGIFSVAKSFMGSSPQFIQRQTRQRRPKARTWNGEATHIYNADFSQRNATFTLRDVRFKGLQYPRSTAIVDLDVPTVNGRAQSWLKPSAFYGYQGASARRYTPKATITPMGAVDRVHVIFSKVPTEAFGPTCAQSALASRDPMALNFPGFPGRNLAVQINAPAAPPGHCLDDPTMAPPAKTLAFQRVRLGHHGRVTVFGWITGPAKKILVEVIGHKGFHSVAHPSVNHHRFVAYFRLQPGSYRLRARYGGKSWTKGHIVVGGRHRHRAPKQHKN